MSLKWDEMTERERDKLLSETAGYTVYDDLSISVNAIHTFDTPTSFRVFRPSVLVAHAMELVEKSKMLFELNGHPHTGWEASLGSHSASAWTMPEAISLAYLGAKGVDV
ncbi:hypothetical protein [Alicyclobacillus dauci]|uniref:Transketolase n=1 Tax=Alicyclobacillus dauci TaxID=1475485 RepID=A0ABY6YY71_9BACL|nr:hypothetical protein [Alicyclobacillus dauci]WAH35024.1 hypothetical protein NZD86_11860 [Alicyclobacillus dauci]